MLANYFILIFHFLFKNLYFHIINLIHQPHFIFLKFLTKNQESINFIQKLYFRNLKIYYFHFLSFVIFLFHYFFARFLINANLPVDFIIISIHLLIYLIEHIHLFMIKLYC